MINDRTSTFDHFYEAQTRLGVATHALVQQARKLAAARALSQDTSALFDELEVLIVVERRASSDMAVAHEALLAADMSIAPRIKARVA